jgi:hypothetical protein
MSRELAGRAVGVCGVGWCGVVWCGVVYRRVSSRRVRGGVRAAPRCSDKYSSDYSVNSVAATGK